MTYAFYPFLLMWCPKANDPHCCYVDVWCEKKFTLTFYFLTKWNVTSLHKPCDISIRIIDPTYTKDSRKQQTINIIERRLQVFNFSVFPFVVLSKMKLFGGWNGWKVTNLFMGYLFGVACSPFS
jgi:hypothetical protein